MPGGKPGGGTGPREEEASHAGDPAQELGAGPSGCREPERSSPEGNGGLLPDSRGPNHWNCSD